MTKDREFPLDKMTFVAASRQTGRRKEGDGEEHEKSFEMRRFPVSPYPEEAALAPSRAAGIAQDGEVERNGPTGGGWT
jgi:hypothetical protein